MPPVRPLLLCLALLACTDPTPPSGPFVDSRSDNGHAWIPGALPLDVLVVLDTSPAMDAYRPIVRRELPTLVDALADSYGGMPDLHLGIISADPMLDARFLTQAYLTDAPTPFQTRRRNYGGHLREIIATSTDRASSGTTTAPLDMAMRALRRPSGFHRPDAALAVVVVAATDDASAVDASEGAVEELAATLKRMKSDPSSLAASTITGDAARLDAFRAQFPNRNATAAITSDDWSDAFAPLGHRLVPAIGPPCWLVATSESECVAWTDETTVPKCGPGVAERCWRMELEPLLCPTGSGTVTRFENVVNVPADGVVVTMQCAIPPNP